MNSKQVALILSAHQNARRSGRIWEVTDKRADPWSPHSHSCAAAMLVAPDGTVYAPVAQVDAEPGEEPQVYALEGASGSDSAGEASDPPATAGRVDPVERRLRVVECIAAKVSCPQGLLSPDLRSLVARIDGYIATGEWRDHG